MSTSTQRFRLIVQGILAILISTLIALGLAGSLEHLSAAPSTRYGRFTAAEIAARSETVCRALSPQAAALRVIAHRDSRRERDGIYRSCWRAECTDAAGTPLSELTWEAETGDLAIATSFEPPSESKGEALDRRDAVRSSWYWLRVLGIAGQDTGWRLAVVPRPPASQWRVEWRAVNRAVVVFLDARTGDYRSAESWRLPATANR